MEFTYIAHRNADTGLTRRIPCEDVSQVATTYLLPKIRRAIETQKAVSFGTWRIKAGKWTANCKRIFGMVQIGERRTSA